MDTLLANFIRVLRNADVRISTAETLDAVRAVELVGYRERVLLKNSLGLVLPKTQDDKIVFDRCFDKFFAMDASGNVGMNRAIPGEDIGTEITQERNGGAASQEEKSAGATSLPQPQSNLGQMLMRGDRMEVGAAIAAAGEAARVQNIQVFTQKGVYTRKVMEAMGLQELNNEMGNLRDSESTPNQKLANELARRREWLRERVRDFVEHQYLLHADVTGKRLQEELLRTIRLSNADQRSLRRMQEMVMQMGKRLASLYSRRRRVFRRGHLHVPKTIRSNLSYDGALFDLRWRSEKIDRPKVFAICDVSGSVANYAKFMLMLLYSLGEALPKVRSFAFSSDLREVTEMFEKFDVETAITRIMLAYGGSTDYGQALSDFAALCLDDVDKRSTIVIIGDARSNNAPLRRDILKAMSERCKRLIWLNPEPPSLWNTGDSEMNAYGIYCHQVAECNSLAHLE
ncbi:MAG TPA: VWA domain-containing protein, partial [Steroidobacteraceae bacterium]|nr:VWA domain-containing protein [Steroidobacteraceae bacterium]